MVAAPDAVTAGAAPALVERAGETAAVALARQLGRSVEVTGLRSEASETFANADGTFSSRFYGGPVRVRRGRGWVPIDTTLRRDVDGSVSPMATVSELRFSGGGTGPAVRLGRADRDLRVSLPWALPAPTLSGDTATYHEVLPGVDLHLRAEVDGYAEVLEIKDRAAAVNPALRSVRFAVATRGLALRAEHDGTLAAMDAGGQPVFGSPGAFQWDSSGPAARSGARTPAGPDAPPGLRQARMPISVNAVELTVIPDAAMLADPGTVFPVFVDPAFVGFSTSWTQVNSGSPNTSYWGSFRDSMRVGLEFGTTTNVWRTIMRIGIGPITNQGQQILEARFFSLLDHSASCTPTSVNLWHTDWISPANAVTWNNTNSFGQAGFWNTLLDTEVGNANEAGGCGVIQPDDWMEWEGEALRSVVQGTANGTCGCLALGLAAAIEDDTSKWKRFYPTDTVPNNQKSYLWVRHSRPPGQPVAQPFLPSDCYLACTSPAVVRTTQPALRVSVSDPDSGNLRSVFEVRNAASDTATLVAGNAAAPVVTAAPGIASWQVPAAALTNATTYYWRARSTDEETVTGGWSAWQTMSVDTTAPAASSVASAQYPFKQWGAQVDSTGSFTLTGLSDVNEFTWSVDGGATTTVTATGTTTKSASVTHTPSTDMVHTLQVTAKDIAGNISATTNHQFWVSPVPARCWYWKLDETSGTTAADSGKPACSPTESTVTAVTGSLTGSTAWAPGHVNNGINLTGGTIAMFQPVLDANKSFTVTAWVQPTSLGHGDQTIAGLDGGNTSRFQLHYDAQANGGTGGWCFSMRATDSASATPATACATGTVPDDNGSTHPPQDNTWVHLAGVFNAITGTIQIHVMGNPISCSGEMTQASFSGSWGTFGSFVLGRATANGAGIEVFRGVLDEVRAYPIALTPQNICQLANQ